MNRKRFSSIMIVTMLCFYITQTTIVTAQQTPMIIPEPQSIKVNNETFKFPTTITVFTKEKGLIKYLNSVIPVKTITNARNATIQLLTSPDILKSNGKEAYTLVITKKQIKITGGSPAGIFYGIQTLRQLLPPKTVTDKSSIHGSTIPCLTINDYPRFKWRGLMIDSGRHFFPIPVIKKMLDLMALQKMNTFHWHLTEDQGWRIEIKKYPKLTEISSKRAASPQHGRRRKSDKTPYGPFFYTQTQIKDIVNYAKERFITVVPEIEMPGHSVAALAAYPELGCTGGPYKVWTKWGISPDIYCAGNDKTYKFLEDVLTEVMGLFPSKFIHIGGDEAPKKNWDKCPKCQAKIKKEGLKNSHELQSYFIKHFDKFLANHGRRLIGWDEILEGGLAPGAAVMSWRGTKGGIKAVKLDHDVVMTPTKACYLDHPESKKKGEPESIGGFMLPLERVYGYNPIPKSFTEKDKKHLLGVQGNLWSEYIWNQKDLEYKAFPRSCAIAEVGWTIPKNKNYKNFIERLKTHLQRLKFLNVNYRPLDTK